MKECSVEWCSSRNITQYTKQLCGKHAKQLSMWGEFRKTIYDPNRIVIHDTYASIFLTDKYCNELAEVFIDLEDVDKVTKYRWGLTYYNYARHNTIGTMHRYVMDIPDDLQCDHINRNTLDNRKSNLRPATLAQNKCNVGLTSVNTSGYKGVNKHGPSWQAAIAYKKQRIYIGTYATKEEAALAYNTKALELHGEFAYLNKVPTCQ